MPPTFDEARAAFPVLDHLAYLNAGTNGPLARTTVEAILAEQLVDLTQGRGGEPYFSRVLGFRGVVRAQLAALLSVEPEQVALTRSTTDGCNIVLAGLGLGPEDEIVTSDVEHFGLIGPLHASGARVVVAPEDGIVDAVTDRTRLIAISHVSWLTGNSLEPERVQAETGLPILVDGAQSAGVIPVEAGAFDFYAISCQKWLCGPDVTGALVVADPGALRVAVPSYFAQTEHQPDGSYVPRPGAERFDSGWIGGPALAGLSAALEVAPEWRFERAAETALRCRAALAERFEVVTKPDQAGLITFRPTSDATELVTRLRDQGVIVREIPGRDLIRVSCGYWTSDEDLDRLLQGLA
ncbi:MAG TPA: aminotransferase class V-fold PLP-dependent enzyme [Gaiellaceae bacterium]|nr:aminotransferase class V-fold PLP-dependent enzyme [Gaiellaceae bacterium]